MIAEALAVLALAFAFAALLTRRATGRLEAEIRDEVATLLRARGAAPRLYELAGHDSPPVATPAHDGSLILDQATWDGLVIAAHAFARAGGLVTPEWWRAQSSIERLAMIEGHERAWAERATAIGTAAHGRREAADVLSRADGGQASLDVALDEAAERLAREAGSAPP